MPLPKAWENVIVFVDANGYQLDGTTEEVLSLGDISQKFSDFGWAAFDVADGNDVEAICSAVENAKSVVGKPKLIVLHTVKGKGCAAALDPQHTHKPQHASFQRACRRDHC